MIASTNSSALSARFRPEEDKKLAEDSGGILVPLLVVISLLSLALLIVTAFIRQDAKYKTYNSFNCHPQLSLNILSLVRLKKPRNLF